MSTNRLLTLIPGCQSNERCKRPLIMPYTLACATDRQHYTHLKPSSSLTLSTSTPPLRSPPNSPPPLPPPLPLLPHNLKPLPLPLPHPINRLPAPYTSNPINTTTLRRQHALLSQLPPKHKLLREMSPVERWRRGVDAVGDDVQLGREGEQGGCEVVDCKERKECGQ